MQEMIYVGKAGWQSTKISQKQMLSSGEEDFSKRIPFV